VTESIRYLWPATLPPLIVYSVGHTCINESFYGGWDKYC